MQMAVSNLAHVAQNPVKPPCNCCRYQYMFLCTRPYALAMNCRHLACLHWHAWRCGPAPKVEQGDLLNRIRSTLPEHPLPHEMSKLTHAFQASSRTSRQTPAAPFPSLRQRIAGRQPLAWRLEHTLCHHIHTYIKSERCIMTNMAGPSHSHQ